MAKKMGLGRGLSAILPDVEEVVESVGHQLPTTIVPTDAVVELPLGDIDPNRDQPRKKFDEEALAQPSLVGMSAVCGCRSLGILHYFVLPDEEYSHYAVLLCRHVPDGLRYR